MDGIVATQQSSEQPKPTRKQSKLPLLIMLAVILLLLTAGGVYYWQHEKVVRALDGQNAALDKSKVLSSQLADLQSKYAKDEATIKSYNTVSSSPTQEDLALNILSAGYVNPAGTVTSGGSWFGIRLTLTNSTSSPITLDVKNFSLEDQQSNTYDLMGFSGATTLPSGWGANTLQDQTIAAGATVTGDIIFQMANKDLTAFTLMNGTKTYPVTATF